jgi:hypothetical protein
MIFHLTGSRFFGTERAESDWDYFAKDSLLNRFLLKVLGFRRIQGQPQKGSDLKAVYRHSIGTETAEQIDVQLRTNIEVRKEIQEAMLEFDLGEILEDKKNAQKVWKLAYRLVERRKA